MSKVSYSLKGAKELTEYLREAPQKVRMAVDDELSDISAEMEGSIALKITHGAKSGATYYRIDNGNGTYSVFANDSEGYVGTFAGAGKKATHRASAAGEAPASDTGNLLKSIYSEKVRNLTYVVGSRADYALHLEYGTMTMGARPFFRPVVEQEKKEINPRLKAAIDGVLK